ncbi:class II fructose-bisphosphate aldolase [Streptomyces sp. XD-27]|uniref:class II fructose-bisphosphate aldolase n=1 Tax=Streptomyces sp. XD-27 TaxID=3062779 RepID=UPI0026F4168F|nr:class II fructose-bisphosphate aldolase [Streptomyces sp. XD-27]WKX73978.1 class II fructose-bisphosphate aldolase [Streptomyces sp. XD-27]
MPLVPTASIVDAARSAGVSALAFNVIHLETGEAIVAAAERTGIPLILQISKNCIDYHGSMLPLLRATLALAEGSGADLSVHLDHLTDPDAIRTGVEAGVRSVMVDHSDLPYEENVRATAEMTAWCHERDVFVEAELGKVGGKGGAHAFGVRTDPDEALAFVRATGVDALAVAVGSSHRMRERTAVLDKELVTALSKALPVPLVLHGSSGVADDELARVVAAGMTKINISSRLTTVFTGVVRDMLEADSALTDSRACFKPAREAVTEEVARLLTSLGS